MMEFYSESKHKSRKERRCAMCGEPIHKGDYYYSECGKFKGDFFARDMHVHCHHMEQEFCEEVDNVFAWQEVSDYIMQKYCVGCDYEDVNDQPCNFDVPACPKIIKLFSEKETKNENC